MYYNRLRDPLHSQQCPRLTLQSTLISSNIAIRIRLSFVATDIGIPRYFQVTRAP